MLISCWKLLEAIDFCRGLGETIYWQVSSPPKKKWKLCFLLYIYIFDITHVAHNVFLNTKFCCSPTCFDLIRDLPSPANSASILSFCPPLSGTWVNQNLRCWSKCHMWKIGDWCAIMQRPQSFKLCTCIARSLMTWKLIYVQPHPVCESPMQGLIRHTAIFVIPSSWSEPDLVNCTWSKNKCESYHTHSLWDGFPTSF